MSGRIYAKHSLPTLSELVATLRAHLPVLQERYGVKTLALFGSYARGQARVRSDLVGVNVDLVMKDALKPTIGRRILAELVPV